MIECVICMEPIDDGISNESTQGLTQGLTLDCNHVFHKTCIQIWLRHINTCPLCRRETFCDNSLNDTAFNDLVAGETYHLVYIDAQQRHTNRCIIIESITPTYIRALCLLRNAGRTFLKSRIVEIYKVDSTMS